MNWRSRTRREVNRQPHPAPVDAGAAESVQQQEIPAAVRHWRYLSNWSDNPVSVDAGHRDTPGKKINNYDLESITVLCTGVGVYQGVLPLKNFPHLVTALKLAINRTLERYTLGDIPGNVSITINYSRIIFGHLIQKGIYSLRDCSHEVLNNLAKDIAERSVLGVMELNQNLALLTIELAKNNELARKLTGAGKGVACSINVSLLSELLGFNVKSANIPLWFRGTARLFADDSREIFQQEQAREPTHGEVVSLMKTMNLYALPAPYVDGFLFQPFKSVNQSAEELIAERREQTPNFTVNEYAAVFSLLLNWVLDYSVHFISLLEHLRKGLNAALDGTKSEKDVEKEICAKHARLVEKDLLPGPAITRLNGLSNPDSLQFQLRLLVIAAGSLVGQNHGRRPNEIYGYDVPYGLYFGCITETPGLLAGQDIEIYASKGPQEYRLFPANGLVVKSVKCLESIFNLTRPLNTSEVVYSAPRSDGRSLNLFHDKHLSVAGFNSSRNQFWHRTYFLVLLEQAGIKVDKWVDKHTPFRRAFAILFVHRYDLPEFPALQRQLAQLDINSCITYYTDRVSRASGESIQEIHNRQALSREDISVLKAIQECRVEYLEQQILLLMSGATIGGVFGLFALKVAKELSSAVDFGKLTAERIASKTAEALIEKGHALEELPHTNCMAGQAKETLRLANCHHEGELHREEATPKKCHRCIHSCVAPSHIRSMVEEQQLALQKSRDVSLPAPLRDGHQRHANDLQKLIDAEVALSTEVQGAVREFTATWNARLPTSEASK